ncbi:HAMP domain-containing protein [Venatoribacter cucullus]|uniref:HAMP domain-containing protein n=1 Tax=Venatoribacter cucullus TaxID=2661630 RepID=UPI001E485377|nr:HAMP domain-containing protein [Venatoribacter cucullus]
MIFHLALNRYVLNPLNLLEQAIVRLRAQQPSLPDLPQHKNGEVGRLLQHFQAMADQALYRAKATGRHRYCQTQAPD